MRKTLIIIAMALFAMPMFAQTIETVDVKKAPDGKFTASGNDCTIEGQVQNGQKMGTWIEYYSGTYLPKKIVNYENGKKNGIFVEIDGCFCGNLSIFIFFLLHKRSVAIHYFIQIFINRFPCHGIWRCAIQVAV